MKAFVLANHGNRALNKFGKCECECEFDDDEMVAVVRGDDGGETQILLPRQMFHFCVFGLFAPLLFLCANVRHANHFQLSIPLYAPKNSCRCEKRRNLEFFSSPFLSLCPIRPFMQWTTYNCLFTEGSTHELQYTSTKVNEW